MSLHPFVLSVHSSPVNLIHEVKPPLAVPVSPSKLIRTFSALFALVLCAASARREPVRAELARLQKDTGLTIASFYRSIDSVDFTNRVLRSGKELLPIGTALTGVLSRDGTEIIFDHEQGLVPDRRSKRRPSSVAVVRTDASNLRDYPYITAAYNLCWSYDKSRLAASVQNLKRGTTPPNDKLEVFSLRSKLAEEVDVRASLTSQCWSPDGKQIVYEADDTVRVYDTERKTWNVLAKGNEATWSSDGSWIAFLDGETYYAIRPSGKDRKLLFSKKGAITGLLWSPDSRIVAYISSNDASEGQKFLDVGSVRLRVRRLDDNSEDWVAQLSDAYIPRYQWVTMANSDTH